jgi:membrane-bound inhibitor of C-type lysozyme
MCNGEIGKGGKMKSSLKCILFVTGLSLCAFTATASDLTLHLAGSEPVSRRVVKFQCDAEGMKLGLPAGSFPVEYVNGAGNSLAVLPIGGSSLIFANVISASGARYAAGRYIWWDAGSRGITLYSDFDSVDGKKQSACRIAETKKQ